MMIPYHYLLLLLLAAALTQTRRTHSAKLELSSPFYARSAPDTFLPHVLPSNAYYAAKTPHSFKPRRLCRFHTKTFEVNGLFECIYDSCPVALVAEREWLSADACVKHLIRDHAHVPVDLVSERLPEKVWVRHREGDDQVYCCLLCNRTGSDSGNLTQHYRNSHIKEAGKAECFHCRKFWTRAMVAFSRHINGDCPNKPKEDPEASVDVEEGSQLRIWNPQTKQFIENPGTLLQDRQRGRLRETPAVAPNRVSKRQKAPRALVPQARARRRVVVLTSYVNNTFGRVDAEPGNDSPSSSSHHSLHSGLPQHLGFSDRDNPSTSHNLHHHRSQPMDLSTATATITDLNHQRNDLNNLSPSNTRMMATDPDGHHDGLDWSINPTSMPGPYNGFIPPGKKI